MRSRLIKDERAVTVEELRSNPHARVLTLTDFAHLLASPDTGRALVMAGDPPALTDGENLYPVINGSPVLYPACISEAFRSGGLELKYHDDAKLQYFLLNQIKQRGEINAAPGNLHYRRHLARMKDLLTECEGSVLDVGCDDIGVSASLFGAACRYIGLDPFSAVQSNSRVIGVGEFLPFADGSLDNVVFNTSLDHILDYQQAVGEARRVLRPGGRLWLCTIAWITRAALHHDAVHFHHFRDYEVDGVLREFGFREASRKEYDYKGDTHRYGLYLSAIKAVEPRGA